MVRRWSVLMTLQLQPSDHRLDYLEAKIFSLIASSNLLPTIPFNFRRARNVF